MAVTYIGPYRITHRDDALDGNLDVMREYISRRYTASLHPSFVIVRTAQVIANLDYCLQGHAKQGKEMLPRKGLGPNAWHNIKDILEARGIKNVELPPEATYPITQMKLEPRILAGRTAYRGARRVSN